jgi:hypothetical protein
MTTNTEILNAPENPNAQIACDLTGAPDTVDERFAEYGRLFQNALAGRERTADAVEFRFAAKPGVAEWVTNLAKREAACCPFMSHHVTADGTHVTWRASSHAGLAAQATLDEFHGLPERLGDGFKGLLERFAARGFTVTAPTPVISRSMTANASPASSTKSKLPAAAESAAVAGDCPADG